MLITPHPDIRIHQHVIGREHAPLLVIDNVLADPDRMVRKAASRSFEKLPTMFPGIRAPAPPSYQSFLEAILIPLLRDTFGLAPGHFRYPVCHFSLVTQAVEGLHVLQRLPHIDSVSRNGLATVHYLFHDDWGGTDFYRHRHSGFEYVDEGRHATYFDRLAQESRDEANVGSGYIGGDTPLFERIARVEGVFNRLIVYRRNSLHSGNVGNDRPLPRDPLLGRLSINSFIDVVP
ncbi:DUF6445 family protein [Pseudoxanthomonas sp. PXM02]|uniref:DUF6445 family protein n=1 Tax=Pseudoxanthomonas sp. PXM02 TaxID=2769294 RepID=UPI0017827D22|nr:DUF6445 family protein [Pseudoxanthomonas sp. PXM02]MBD9481192.1 hypothetical protein [Pseudoxanthomonas sp. PXM02]